MAKEAAATEDLDASLEVKDMSHGDLMTLLHHEMVCTMFAYFSHHLVRALHMLFVLLKSMSIDECTCVVGTPKYALTQSKIQISQEVIKKIGHYDMQGKQFCQMCQMSDEGLKVFKVATRSHTAHPRSLPLVYGRFFACVCTGVCLLSGVYFLFNIHVCDTLFTHVYTHKGLCRHGLE